MTINLAPALKKISAIQPLIAALLITSALFLGCNKRDAERWEYKTFEYSADQKDEAENKWWITFVCITEGDLTETGHAPRTLAKNQCHSLDAILNDVGRYGWELASSEGGKYTVKRHPRKGNSFYVSRELSEKQ